MLLLVLPARNPEQAPRRTIDHCVLRREMRHIKLVRLEDIRTEALERLGQAAVELNRVFGNREGVKQRAL
jgi:hypothetical protein